MPRPRHGGTPLKLALALLILAAVASGGTMIYVALRPRQGTPPAEQLAPAAVRPVAPITVRNLEMPDEAQRLLTWSWMRYRPPRAYWTAEEVDYFWIDPGQIGAEYLSETNRRLIEELLRDVP